MHAAARFPGSVTQVTWAPAEMLTAVSERFCARNPDAKDVSISRVVRSRRAGAPGPPPYNARPLMELAADDDDRRIECFGAGAAQETRAAARRVLRSGRGPRRVHRQIAR